jgi:hypothetical protein
VAATRLLSNAGHGLWHKHFKNGQLLAAAGALHAVLLTKENSYFAKLAGESACTRAGFSHYYGFLHWLPSRPGKRRLKRSDPAKKDKALARYVLSR